jgi:broad specificity phosphatase PhoE
LALREESFDLVLTSPLSRARESARLILGDRTLESIACDDLREVNFGHWEGMTHDEVRASDPDAYRAWTTSSLEFRYPGGDLRQAFWDRVQRAAEDWAARPIASALWVLHKGVIKVALQRLLDIDTEQLTHMCVDLGSIHRIVERGHGWRLVTGNQVDHLGDACTPDPR